VGILIDDVDRIGAALGGTFTAAAAAAAGGGG